MQLEGYFDFLSDTDIRISGTRVGLEVVVHAYEQGASPEEILIRYPALSLEQVHAVILYFLANQEQVRQYVARTRLTAEKRYEAWRTEPEGGASAFVRALRDRLDAERKRLREEQHGRQETKVLVG